jgi:hypothetical protein
MADYIRFRLATARIGVSMAFFALLAGIAERAQAASPPAPGANFLREISIPSGGGLDRIVIQKLDSALATLEHKLNTSFDTTQKINQTFLKIKSADTSFLKIKSANADFLKIDSANANFLKIDDANASFLKIDDANSEFLKIDSTAANSSELGGLTPDAFFQGNGHVVTGAVSNLATSNTPTQLLSLPGGIIVVSVANTVGAGVQLSIHNASGVGLPAVQTVGDTTTSTTLSTTQDYVTNLTASGEQLHIQIFPSGASFPDVVTLIVSCENQSGLPSFVGQAFTGGV